MEWPCPALPCPEPSEDHAALLSMQDIVSQAPQQGRETHLVVFSPHKLWEMRETFAVWQRGLCSATGKLGRERVLTRTVCPHNMAGPLPGQGWASLKTTGLRKPCGLLPRSPAGYLGLSFYPTDLGHLCVTGPRPPHSWTSAKSCSLLSADTKKERASSKLADSFACVAPIASFLVSFYRLNL